MQSPVICLVTAVFNDWDALAQLLRDLEPQLRPLVARLNLVVVNDGSTSAKEPWSRPDFPHELVGSTAVLDLRANVGNQTAIAAGLHYCQQYQKFDAVLIMDADGEDRPVDAAKLVTTWLSNPANLVVAERAKRSESLAFKAFYALFRRIFRALTGHAISFGNFSVIPAHALPDVISRPELIHHFAATLLRTRLPITKVPTKRGQRYAGLSHMNIPALVLHAVSGLSVFSDVLFSRMLIAAAYVCVLCGISGVGVICLRLFTDLAFPNWATTVIGFVALLAAQAIMLILCTGFLLLTSRATMLLTALEMTRLIRGVRESKP